MLYYDRSKDGKTYKVFLPQECIIFVFIPICEMLQKIFTMSVLEHNNSIRIKHTSRISLNFIKLLMEIAERSLEFWTEFG